eukprot:TRINITY_DN18087_c0_g1_i1.p1 TRINITY_DN18087_c0_g1~~TRINITY_DN18087_c0_g1_i1.p1  ORF type:complete len:187 (-),score=31.64 TRINITY_DN18087_c0_g1_i1:22-582(-)
MAFLRSLVLLCIFLLSPMVFGGWVQKTCNGGSVCPVQFDDMLFDGSILRATISQSSSTSLEAGQLTMTTEGHGCILFFCQWADGPTLDNPTCDWPGMTCSGNQLFAPGVTQKDVHMDFRTALDDAKATTGCCTEDSKCGCKLRGTATFRNSGGEYSVVYIEFTCDFDKYICTLDTKPSLDLEVINE